MNEPTPFEPTHCHYHHTSDRIDGAMLIGFGLILLLQYLIGFSLYTSWVLLILLPAAGVFTATWVTYHEAGRSTAAVCSSALGRIVMGLVVATFLFGLSWDIIGPVLILVAGAALLLNEVVPR